MNFILIDGSYYIFYRYYALKVWWNKARHPNEPEEPKDSERFIEKFCSTFISKIKEIDKKLKLSNSIKLVGKDCPQENIWRNKYTKNYKDGRANDNNIGFFFKIAYEQKLFEKAGINTILEYPSLEADDCIALTTKHMVNKHSNYHIYIIANDMDYLQLAKSNVKIYDLKFKDITESKRCFKNPEKDLFCKIVAGDKSDNINAIFPKCGIKTAEKYFHDKELFQSKLIEFPEAQSLYEKNRIIIDFEYIPSDLQDAFNKNVLKF
tara:strand:+ start:108 stop:899 length:792 start_codon:yes stop_codon:yes gene_type:complete